MNLPKNIAEKYDVVDWPTPGAPKLQFGKFGTVDLTKLTEQQAESLINRGFKKLKRKQKASKNDSEKAK